MYIYIYIFLPSPLDKMMGLKNCCTCALEYLTQSGEVWRLFTTIILETTENISILIKNESNQQLCESSLFIRRLAVNMIHKIKKNNDVIYCKNWYFSEHSDSILFLI